MTMAKKRKAKKVVRRASTKKVAKKIKRVKKRA